MPEGMGHRLEERFAQRARLVDGTPGFQGFELLRPVSGDERYFVVTHWDTHESFEAWTKGRSFSEGHSTENKSGPVGMSADLLEFEVVDLDEISASLISESQQG